MSTGPLTIKHNTTQYCKDRDGFWSWMYKARTKITEEIENKRVRQEPGDMGLRGIWIYEEELIYTPYSQLSCAVGQAVVRSVNHLERLCELTNEYGKGFLFTAVGEHLKQFIRSNPDKFAQLYVQESWMGKTEVWVVTTRI